MHRDTGQLWPRVNHALSTMGRQQLDPLMKDSKPGWISSVQLDRWVIAELLNSAQRSVLSAQCSVLVLSSCLNSTAHSQYIGLVSVF